MTWKEKLRNKKSQITVFMIIGIILLVGTGIFLFARNEQTTSDLNFVQLDGSTFQLKTETVNAYVDSCLKRTLLDGVFFVANQGGYYNLPKEHLPTEEGSIPFYFFEDSRMVPTIDKISREISEYIDENIYFCLGDFEPFTVRGIDVEGGIPNSVTTIGEKFITVEIDIPITVKDLLGKRDTSEFIASVPIRFRPIYEAMLEIISNKDIIGLTKLSQSEYLTNVVLYSNTEVIYSIYDKASSIPGQAFLYFFAIKYSEEESNTPPKIDTIYDEIIIVGKHYHFEPPFIDVDGDKVEFSTDTALFLIDKETGTIDFTPTKIDVGIYNVRITATDGKDSVYQDVVYIIS